MPADPAPESVHALAEARARARRERDWDTADRLKTEIEATGWKVIDAATLYSLERAAPPDVVDGDVVRYGSSASVPSRLDEPARPGVTIVLVADGTSAAAERSLAALERHAPAGSQVVVVANGPAVVAPPSSLVVEVLATSVRLPHAAALNAGIRRATGSIVIVLAAGIGPPTGTIEALAAALDDPGVAIAGSVGLVTDDLARWERAATGQTVVAGLAGEAMAFRRADYAARGPLDEVFGDSAFVAPWWSLVLRDTGEDEPDDAAPRSAVVVPGEPLPGAEPWTWTATGPEADRAGRKGRYRLLRWFAGRRDLVVRPG